MTGIVDWAAKHARMVLALIVLSITAGVMAYVGLPKEGEPDIEIPAIFVSVPFPGISAEDSEKLLVKPMETELADLDSLKTMGAIAQENYAGIILEFDFGWDKTKLMAERLKSLGAEDVLVCVEAFDEKVFLASRNLPRVGYLEVDALDPVSLIRFEKVVMTVAALRKLEEKLA